MPCLEMDIARARAALERLGEMKTRQVTDPALAVQTMEPLLRDREQEVFVVLLLDTRLRPIDIVELYKGNLDGLTVRPAEVFREAVRKNAAAIIVGHNHPSGHAEPSPQDLHITRVLARAGRLLEIPVHDHIVYGAPQAWCSLREQHPDTLN